MKKKVADPKSSKPTVADMYLDYVKTIFPPKGRHTETVETIKADLRKKIAGADTLTVVGRSNILEEDHDYWRFGVSDEWWREELGFTEKENPEVAVVCSTKRPMNRREYELSVSITFRV